MASKPTNSRSIAQTSNITFVMVSRMRVSSSFTSVVWLVWVFFILFQPDHEVVEESVRSDCHLSRGCYGVSNFFHRLVKFAAKSWRSNQCVVILEHLKSRGIWSGSIKLKQNIVSTDASTDPPTTAYQRLLHLP